MSLITIIDDDEAMRESLTTLLTAEGLKTRSFDSADAFLRAGGDREGGCLVLDIHMPGMTGLDLQAELRRRGAGLPVVMITGQGDVPQAVAALKAGAVDFLEKPYSVDSLLKAVREALDREGRLRRLDRERSEVESRLALLSKREREVMDLMVMGHPNKLIASTLGISARTVENHRAKVMEKMECESLPALIHLTLEQFAIHSTR
jgi:FixJ family two-component response regulator